MSEKTKYNPFPLALHLAHMREIGQLQNIIKDLVNFIEEERDFWEWLEDGLGETRKELWERYEKFRDETEGSITPILRKRKKIINKTICCEPHPHNHNLYDYE